MTDQDHMVDPRMDRRPVADRSERRSMHHRTNRGPSKTHAKELPVIPIGGRSALSAVMAAMPVGREPRRGPEQTKAERVSCDEPTGGHERFIVIMFAGEALEGAGDGSTNSAGAAILSHAGRALPLPSRTDRAKSFRAAERHARAAAQRSVDAFRFPPQSDDRLPAGLRRLFRLRLGAHRHQGIRAVAQPKAFGETQ